MPLVEEWRLSPLQTIYAIIYIDGIRYKESTDGRVREKSVYGVRAKTLTVIHTCWGFGLIAETAKGWLSVLTDLHISRGQGYPHSHLRRVDWNPGGGRSNLSQDHLSRVCGACLSQSLKYVGYFTLKAFAADLRAIYQAPTEDAAWSAFEQLDAKWGEKYPLAVTVWERNWDRISAMFAFTPEIRQLIYTTNPIESFHRQLRKVTKNRGVFKTMMPS
jgi:transposase-like protein